MRNLPRRGTTLELSALGSNWVTSEPMLMHEQVLPQTCQRKPEWVLERQWGQRYIPPCPHGWYQEAPNCYWIGPDLQTATEAEKTCAKEGAHLASIPEPNHTCHRSHNPSKQTHGTQSCPVVHRVCMRCSYRCSHFFIIVY